MGTVTNEQIAGEQQLKAYHAKIRAIDYELGGLRERHGQRLEELRAAGKTVATIDDKTAADLLKEQKAIEALKDQRMKLSDERASVQIGGGVLRNGGGVPLGFRRNLWGRKLIGLTMSILAAGVAIGILVGVGGGHSFTVPAGVALGYSLIACALWVFTITPDWVKQSADAYAIRLIESAVRVPPREAGK